MSETRRIYFGSSMVAMGLVARLNEIGISPIERNDHDSGLRAGFAPTFTNQTAISIREDEMDKAQPIIDEFLMEIGEEGSNN